MKNPERFKEKEQESKTLESFLQELKDEGIEVLSIEDIKEQLENTGRAIVTRDFVSGIRISKHGKSGEYKSWTTNALEDPEHPLAKKFGHKQIRIEEGLE